MRTDKIRKYLILNIPYLFILWAFLKLGTAYRLAAGNDFAHKKSHYVSEDNWTVFENTQEAIIDQETFDNVQRIRSNVRRYPDGWGEAHPLTGLMYCADCGSKMYVHRVNNGKRVPQYTCSAYPR